ncbi:head completion/stabilization protein [Sphingobium sp. B11D3D]|uniref:head completion/stabilization protein n=1 Tax=Sphingobium sp. B11D3D TaxID=2940576 RepID=UPI002224B9FD|nr:head completion/stabilization protein [Sphingobium sp. B11D3D]MCW2370213.1 hypothetical protein [Sphingobium sp. B11D3D]
MSFVTSPQPPATPDDHVIAFGEFWPAIDINAFRDAMRIGGNLIPDARVVEALVGGLIIVDDNLSVWRDSQIAAGHEALAHIPSTEITVGAGQAAVIEPRLVRLFRRAVYAWATADLIETHRDVSATASGVNDANQVELTPDDHRRNGTHAIRAILGTSRTAVELI